ncbi:protein fantom [Anoplopoma fimbria]|uniref:protein fantom n=1 Tax=Anoplopoma fimbria TaxID=229290 RepID=UPI0023ED1E9A|nr:protein fantom [Anoplopoma fimbria]
MDMSSVLDDTSADVPVRDFTVDLSRLTADPSVYQNARARQDISRVSREELEDRFLRLHEETLLLKQHVHKQEDKIKKLGTKLMRLVKDRGRMEQLAVGGGGGQLVSRVRDVEMEEMMEELQEKARGLQAENEGLKQRLLVAKQQLINSQSRRSSPYGRVQSRVHTGLKKLRDDSSSPSQPRPKSTRSSEGGARPPTGLLPRFGHSLLEETRAEVRNLENVIELQRSHMEEMEGTLELLREELRRKEAEYEERLLQVREHQTSKLRSHVSGNVAMIKLQKQLSDRSDRVTELEGRFLQLQESQRALKVSHDAAMLKVDELSGQLKDERMKSLDLEKRLQSSNISRMKMEQLQERIGEVEQERDLLKDNNDKLVNSAFDVSRQQKWQIQEQQLKLQIAQLETALKADLMDKNEILDKIKAERDSNEKLTEENQKLQLQFLEQKQQLEELNDRLKFYSRENEYDVSELTEALLLVKKRKSQRSGDLGFLKEVEDGGGSSSESAVRELRAAHAETIQELEKTRNLLSMEGRISRDYRVELEAVLKKMEADRVESEQKLERQAALLDSRAAKIHKLEAQLRDVAYGTKTFVFRPDVPDEEEKEEESEKEPPLERGENLVELQVVGATLSPSTLQALGEAEPSTFCTYAFYLFELHATPVATGPTPRYGFTSRYVVSMDQRLLDFLLRGSVTVELHQALGLDWRTLARGRIQLKTLLEPDGRVQGSVPLVGVSDEARSFGSVDYWLRLKVPMTETLRLFREKVEAGGYVSAAPDLHAQPPGGCNELLITIQRCRDLKRSSVSQQPSPYVVYKFFAFPDYPTATVHDCCDPDLHDLQVYSVPMDADLDRYLRTEDLRLYVFDYKEQQMDTYVGKTRVPLLPLARDQGVSGEFELTDPSGLSAGLIEVSLRWRFSYLPPSASIMAAEETERKRLRVEDERRDDEETLQEEDKRPPDPLPEASGSKAERPKPRLRTRLREGPAARKVTFMDPSAPEDQGEDGESADRKETLPPVGKVSSAPPPHSTTEEEDEEEESHFSEGQLVPTDSPSPSDDSEISEDIVEDVEERPAAGEPQSESSQSDSDDCIVHGPTAGRKPSQRLRVEVVSLTLRPESRVSLDVSVVRLFVEFSLLDLPTEETPLSLHKLPRGHSINYNYSKVVPVDSEDNGPRRRLLRRVLQGRNPQMERIRFTVVSEPPEEEEQERECEDVGVAFIRIKDILERQQDLMESSLDVLDVEDSSQVVGSLTVTVEGLEALQAIMEDQEQDQELTSVSSLLPSA